VHQIRIGDTVQSRQRLVVVAHDGFAAGVGAGHDQSQSLRDGEPVGAGRPPCRFVEENELDRRARQHGAEFAQARRDARQRTVAAFAFLQQHHRPLARFEQGALGFVHFGVLRHRRRIREHHGEGLLLAVLAFAQARDGFGIACIAGEVIAAEALDGNDLAAQQARQGFGDGVARHIPQRELRTAYGTGIRLRMEAAVGRVVVFAPAGRAHFKSRHAGVRPVVGQMARQRIARAAMRAVDEGVAPAAVGGIEQLGEAVRAGGGIGRHRGIRRAVATDFYFEAACIAERRFRRLHRGDARQRGRFRLQPDDQRLDCLRRALRLDVHALAVVAHPAGELQLLRQAIDEGPEADALHLTAHADAAADEGGDERGCHCRSGVYAAIRRRFAAWTPLLQRPAPARPATRPCPRRFSPRPAAPRSSD